MTLAIAFWIIIFIWVLAFGWAFYQTSKPDTLTFSTGFIPLILFILLGWAVFGAPIKG